MADPKDPRTFFSQHHAAYVTSPRHAHGKDLDILIESLGPKPGAAALDVATGGGHTALRMAGAGAQVTVADITPEMLQDTQRQAEERGMHVKAVIANAEALPFADGTFDLVSCRRAPHHFHDIGAFLSEARRVLSSSGRLGISDMTGSAAGINWLNQLERLRDPSHNEALAIDAWYYQLVLAGFKDISLQIIEEYMPFEEWLTPVMPTSVEGKEALQFLSQPDAPWEFVRGSQFVKRRLIAVAYR